MRSAIAVSFRTRCLRGLLLAVQLVASGMLAVAHANEAAAITAEIRVEDPRTPSNAPVHDDRQCLTCRTLASVAHLTAPQRHVQLRDGVDPRTERPARALPHATRSFTAPLAPRPPPLA